MNNFIRLVTTLFIVSTIVACHEATTEAATEATTEAVAPKNARSLVSGTALTIEQQGMWLNNCALCHISGQAGAPRAGVEKDWAKPKAKGIALLLEHTLEGFNKMPPLGYCMACERDDFVALINFMAGDVP